MNELLQAQTRARSRQIASRLEMRPMTTGQLLVSWRDLIQLADQANIGVEVYTPSTSSAAGGLTPAPIPRETLLPRIPACPACQEERQHTAAEYDQHHESL